MGWTGKVLRIDLTTRRVTDEPLNQEWADLYLGQRGLASKYLSEEMDPRTDALSPDNKLIFATGPLTGTMASTGGRYSVVTKGALTNTIAASNSGGTFGAAIKNAGWDMIILEGRAETPVYLVIENDQVAVLPADDLWGMTVWDADAAIRADHTELDFSIAAIGQAGETGVRYACVINDLSRAAGRSGVGTVMGSKNLKALAVRGSLGVRVAEPDLFLKAVGEARAVLDESGPRKHLAAKGTLSMMDNTNGFGSLPTRNARHVQFEHTAKINAAAVVVPRESDGQPNLSTNKACFACSIGCGRVATINPAHFSLKTAGFERYKNASGGLEYENSFALGAMCGVDDIDAVTFANFVCDEQGMDTISFGGTLAAAMELYEVGAINDEITGMPIPFGSAEALVEMVQLAGRGEGFGVDLGLGAARLCEKYGRPELAMVVKGQEIAGYDPRGMQGMALAYATNNRGACHTRGTPFVDDFVNVTPEGKPETVADLQNLVSAWDSSGLCGFTRGVFKLEGLAGQLSPATGQDWTAERLEKTGERIWNIERLFNLAAGFTKADDTLPPRFLKDPAPSGTAEGWVAKLDEMLPQYYQIRGWDKGGIPTLETRKRLGLE